MHSMQLVSELNFLYSILQFYNGWCNNKTILKKGGYVDIYKWHLF